MMTDVIPFFSIFLVYFIDRYPKQMGARKRLGSWGLGIFCAWSFFVHAQGAIFEGPTQWNAKPTNVGTSLERLWDWTDPPYFRFSGI